MVGSKAVALIILLLLLSGCGELATPTVIVSPTPLPATATPIPPTATSQPVITGSAVFSLLADNRLVAVRLKDGALLTEQALGPALPPATQRATGHYLALSKDKRLLYALAPGGPEEADRLAVIDTATGRVRATYTLAESTGKLSGVPENQGMSVYRSLTVGAKSGRVYLFGNRGGSVIVTAVDPNTGAEAVSWTARKPDGRSWVVYQGEVNEDESRLFISYHGVDTTGIDRFEIGETGLNRCLQSYRPGTGCLVAHGSFIFYQSNLLAATGDTGVIELDQSGMLKREFYPALGGTHVKEFAVDSQSNLFYAVGACDTGGGFSALDLQTAGMPIVGTGQGEWRRLATPGPLRVLVSPDPQGQRKKKPPCGERVGLGPENTLVVGKTTNPTTVTAAGALIFLNTVDGQTLQTVDLTSSPLDVLVNGN